MVIVVGTCFRCRQHPTAFEAFGANVGDHSDVLINVRAASVLAGDSKKKEKREIGGHKCRNIIRCKLIGKNLLLYT